MRVRRIVGGPISTMLLLSIPVVALLALSPWSSASPAAANGPDELMIGRIAAGSGDVTSSDMAIDELSDWTYTDKSMKSHKSEKSKKSPKSQKSHKSKKSKKPSQKPPKH